MQLYSINNPKPIFGEVARFACKACNLKDMREQIKKWMLGTSEAYMMLDQEWEFFKDSLLDDWGFLAGKGGTYSFTTTEDHTSLYGRTERLKPFPQIG